MTEGQTNQSSAMQTLWMVILETLLSFVIKHDRFAQLHAQKFVEQRITVFFNLVLPDCTFYVTFDPRGVFFDQKQPADVPQVHLQVDTSGIDLVRILLTGKSGLIRQLRITGTASPELQKDFRLLLSSVALPTLLADWRNWFSAENTAPLPKPSVKNLTQHIEQQRKEITKLTIKVKSYQYDLKTLRKKHQLLSYLYWLIIAILVGVIVFLLF